jgi:glc operon protein GlcG
MQRAFGGLVAFVLLSPLSAHGQQWPFGYGAPISVEQARKTASAAVAEAKKNGWNVAAAVVDPAGVLVFYEKMDGTQVGSAQVAIDKARSSAQFRRPTKVFEDAVNGGKTAFLGLQGAVPLEGGLPLVVAGKIIGAVGVSGATAQQDGQCAKAGAEALGPLPVIPSPAAAAAPAATEPPKK